MKRPWDINRALIVLGSALCLAAFVVFLVVDPSQGAGTLPLVAGAVLGLAIVFWAPPWMYLVSGILVSGFPLVVFFVFGAYGALEHPGGGPETSGLFLVFAGAVVALVGGVAGFVQARKGTAPRVGAGMGAPLGAFAGLFVALLLGMVLANQLTYGDSKDFVQRPVSHVETPEVSKTLVAEGIRFAPASLEIPVGKLTAVTLRNDDRVFHTMSYRDADGIHTAVIPDGTTQTLWFKFDAARTIHYWCDPHSSETDTSPEGMHGDIVAK